MGQICNGLSNTLKLLIPHFVKQKGQDDRGRKTEYQIVNTEQYRVLDQASKIDASEKPGKVGKSYPWAVRHSQSRRIILKRNDCAIHGLIMKQQVKNQYQDHQKIQRTVANPVFPQPVTEIPIHIPLLYKRQLSFLPGVVTVQSRVLNFQSP